MLEPILKLLGLMLGLAARILLTVVENFAEIL